MIDVVLNRQIDDRVRRQDHYWRRLIDLGGAGCLDLKGDLTIGGEERRGDPVDG